MTQQLLLALVPYSKPNLKLTFAPSQFFAELTARTRASKQSLASTFSRAKRQGLVEMINGRPYLTAEGQARLPLDMPGLLSGEQWLIVIFDIPEDQKVTRERFREYLKSLGYSQLQKSVWVCQSDTLILVKEAISELGLGRWTKILRGESVFPQMRHEFLGEAESEDEA